MKKRPGALVRVVEMLVLFFIMWALYMQAFPAH